ncbi:MAG TPA: HEAT repeat domain-containing protein [Planctomycetaceae bacterium]|jgi:HEAT repeat protein|nr:HEAT repeat domain-containing protein [Planctomycetaceae bacterium]
MSREVLDDLPRDGDQPVLPPVEPPSAGFIMQLFVVPALIVLAVVVVWAFFGKIAASEEDWRELVEDIRNTNEHRRWRGADGLARLLQNDQQLGDGGQRLAANPEIARTLVGLFDEQLKKHSQRDDDLKQEAFVARTLGLLDSPNTVLPALERGMQSEQDREVRKNSIASIAVIAGRASEVHHPLDDSTLVNDLVTASGDPDKLIRDVSTYALGLIPTDASRDRLTVLLSDGDRNTRVNAAVGLARQNSTAGFPVFKDVLQSAGSELGGSPGELEGLLSVKNSLHAVKVLAGHWTAPQRSELVALIDPITQHHPEPRLRTDANDALVSLRANSPQPAASR